MKVIDTNFIINAYREEVLLKNEYFAAPDVLEELKIDPGIKIPSNVKDGRGGIFFSMPVYLGNYSYFLNKYCPSFYNMTSFGDISTLAFIRTVLENIKRQATLPTMEENIILFADDEKLSKRVIKEFSSEVKIIKFANSEKNLL
ncbi:MAG: hypothetical protein IPJ68_01375 [Candidatus Moraniibacteriota bacterium]|nr:MAG: hypothetical protein IPJ68_01375 [Candidatus Moranbacteria bacterium]